MTTASLFDDSATTRGEWAAIEAAFEHALGCVPAVAAKLKLPEERVLACWGELLALLAPAHYAPDDPAA